MTYTIYSVMGNPKRGIGYFYNIYRKNMSPQKAKIEWTKIKNYKHPTSKYYLIPDDQVETFLKKLNEINKREEEIWEKRKEKGKRNSWKAYEGLVTERR